MNGGIPPLTVDFDPCGLRVILCPLDGPWQLRVTTGLCGPGARIRRTVHESLSGALHAGRQALLEVGRAQAEVAWENLRSAFAGYSYGLPGLRPRCPPLRQRLNAEADHLALLRLALAKGLHALETFASTRDIVLNPVDIPEWLAMLKGAIHDQLTEESLLEGQLDAITDALLKRARA